MDAFSRIGRSLWRQPYLLLIVAVATWGGNAIAGRLAVGEVSPMAIVCLRWLVVVVVLLPLALRIPAADGRLLGRRWLYVFAMGGLGFTTFNALFYSAAHYTTAVNMGVIQGVIPAVVIAGSFLVYRTPIRTLQVIGIVTTLVGVVVTATQGDLQVLRDLAFNIGDLGIVLAAVLYGAYTVALRGRPAVSPIAFFAAMAAAACLTSLPLLAWEVANGTVVWPTGKGWALIGYIALLPSLVAQLLYMRGVELIGPGRAGLFMNLIPVFAALGGVLLLGEHVAVFHAVALALVLGGIWLAERPS